MRVARGGESTPPEWAVDLLHELARKVLRFRQGFEEEKLAIDTGAGGMHA